MTKTKETNVRFEAETSPEHMIRLSVQKVAFINEINIFIQV